MVSPAAALPNSRHIARVVSLAAGCTVFAVGGLVLIGWYFDIDALKGPYARITMKSNTAVAMLLAGIALWAHARNLRTVGICCASAIAALGALTLSEHLSGVNLGIDETLFPEPAGALATASPNRMGPNASTSLLLAGTGLLLLFRGGAGAIASAQWLAVTGILLAVLAIAGYVYGATELYAVPRYTGIGLHTTLSLLVLSIGILATRVDEGPMAEFVSEGPSGTLLRRLVAPIFLIPLALGYVVIRGREADLYDRATSFALFSVFIVVILGTIIWTTARSIAISEQHRRRAEHDRDLLLVRERRARDEAESASRLKDQFIAMLSHELRTPLNVMLGWTKHLEGSSSPERYAHAASVVARNGRLLARLVEDLLDISRVSAGQFEISPRPMLFNGAVQASIDALASIAAEKGIRLAGELDPAVGSVEGDPERIQQIVWNLLSNAVKFTGSGGRIEVRTAASSEAVTLTVCDTGIGFDQAFASHLFQPFARRIHRRGESTAVSAWDCRSPSTSRNCTAGRSRARAPVPGSARRSP